MEKQMLTPSQTIGPFFAYSLTAAQYGYPYNSIIGNAMLANHDGECIEITGSVFDGEGHSIHDAMIEFWQADTTGVYRSLPIHLNDITKTGFGRCGTGTYPENRFQFTTIKPGSVNGQPPHINVILFMRGALLHLYTRIYFSDEKNDEDALLQAIPSDRRHTVIAKREDNKDHAVYYFNIYLQGENETVFFDM
jgi:protocatechuate 3,4-dioxygenase alpha subunit